MRLLCYSGLAMRESSDTLLVNYLSTIGGDLPWIEPLPELASKLPPFLKQRYRISRADLFGRKYLLAIEEPREGDPSPTEYVIESAFSIVEQVCRNVKRWHGGDQRERWVGYVPTHLHQPVY